VGGVQARADIPLPLPRRVGIVVVGVADVALGCAALAGRTWPRRARLATAVAGLVVVLALVPVRFEIAATWQDVRSGHAGLLAAGSFVVAALALVALGDGAGRRRPRLAVVAAMAVATLGFAVATARERDAGRASAALLGVRIDPSEIPVTPIWGLPASSIDPVRHMVVAERVRRLLAGCGRRGVPDRGHALRPGDDRRRRVGVRLGRAAGAGRGLVRAVRRRGRHRAGRGGAARPPARQGARAGDPRPAGTVCPSGSASILPRAGCPSRRTSRSCAGSVGR
jgi:hypothetical protein